jgi:exonuclease SbcD
MTPKRIRLLLVADTHLGFDLPFHPRIERRRRGPDFFANFQVALQPAMRGEVDLVVHGGDLLYRSRVPPALVDMALKPLVEVAKAGVPVYLVPGNHERSHIPMMLWGVHPNLHIFDRPRTFVEAINGYSLALSGFPFRREIRSTFKTQLIECGYQSFNTDVRFLCLHQAVEGAKVGPADYTFRSGADVIPGRDIPAGFHYVLCGHIHRAQVLTHDLARKPLASPVVYPGSIERTAFAERDETKGYAIIEIDASSAPNPANDVTLVPLPARPMHLIRISPVELGKAPMTSYLAEQIASLPEDAVVSLRLEGTADWVQSQGITAKLLRQMAPETMNISMGVKLIDDPQ